MKLQEGQVFNNAGIIDIGELAGDKSINFYIVVMKIGMNLTAYHLDCDGKNPKFEAYPDICKPGIDGIDWDMTIFPDEQLARDRARDILKIEYPNLNHSAI